MNNIWLSKEVFELELSSMGGTSISNEPIKRAYTIWEHSKTLIEGAKNDFQLADGITNLKRSLNHRLKLIEEIYNFKLIDINNKPRGYLELLERYEIVRPYLMKNLFAIRNDIEHNDAPPPNLYRCKELLDVVWYFLKSTDRIVQLVQDAGFDPLDEKEKFWCEIRVNYGIPFSIEIKGVFPEEVVSFKEKDGFFLINNKQPLISEFRDQEHEKDFYTYLQGPINLKTIQVEKLIGKLLMVY